MTRRVGWIPLVLFAGALYLPWTGARDLWNPNEPTYGRAVAEMAAAGAWAVPTVHGEAFAEKPILWFWLARLAAIGRGGVDEWSLRLPSVAAGMIAVALVYLLVVPYAGRRRAAIAGVVLATTYIVFWSARTAQMDLLVATTSLAAIVCASRVVDFGLAPARGWALAGAAAGLGFLAKGPTGLIVPGLVVLVYLVATGRPREAFRPAVLAAAAGFVVVAAPWYVLLALRGESAFLHELLWRQNVTRFFDPWDHQAPAWYYLVHFWTDMAPWSLFVPLASGLQPADERERRLHRLAWGWLAVVVVFFSLSASKRSPYILPVAPAVAVLVSALASRRIAGRLGRLRTGIALGLHGLLAAGLLGLALWLRRDPRWMAHADPDLASAARTIVVAALAAGLLVAGGVVLSWVRRFAAPLVLTAVVAAFYLVAAATALPAANAVKSHRPFARAILEHVGPGEPLRGYFPWRWRAGYSYYANRSIPHLDSFDELRAYWDLPQRVYLVVERGTLEQARRVVGPIEPLAERAIGSNRAYLFASDGGR